YLLLLVTASRCRWRERRGLFENERFVTHPGTSSQPDVGINRFLGEAQAAVAHQDVHAPRMEAACGGDELPPVAIRAPAGAVGRQQVVIPVPPDVPFVPRITPVAPDTASEGHQVRRSPVAGLESSPRGRQRGCSKRAEVETVGALVRGYAG